MAQAKEQICEYFSNQDDWNLPSFLRKHVVTSNNIVTEREKWYLAYKNCMYFIAYGNHHDKFIPEQRRKAAKIHADFKRLKKERNVREFDTAC